MSGFCGGRKKKVKTTGKEQRASSGLGLALGLVWPTPDAGTNDYFGKNCVTLKRLEKTKSYPGNGSAAIPSSSSARPQETGRGMQRIPSRGSHGRVAWL